MESFEVATSFTRVHIKFWRRKQEANLKARTELELLGRFGRMQDLN